MFQFYTVSSTSIDNLTLSASETQSLTVIELVFFILLEHKLRIVSYTYKIKHCPK